MSLLNYLDNHIEQQRLATGNYPEKLFLSKEGVDLLKKEIKEGDYTFEGCWSELEPLNYRGIPIIEKEVNNEKGM